MRDLEAQGYFVVRSAGSHGPCDLVALGPAGISLVQCKLDGKLSAKDKAALLAVSHVGKFEVLRVLKASRPKRGEIRYEELR